MCREGANHQAISPVKHGATDITQACLFGGEVWQASLQWLDLGPKLTPRPHRNHLRLLSSPGVAVSNQAAAAPQNRNQAIAVSQALQLASTDRFKTWKALRSMASGLGAASLGSSMRRAGVGSHHTTRTLQQPAVVLQQAARCNISSMPRCIGSQSCRGLQLQPYGSSFRSSSSSSTCVRAAADVDVAAAADQQQQEPAAKKQKQQKQQKQGKQQQGGGEHFNH